MAHRVFPTSKIKPTKTTYCRNISNKSNSALKHIHHKLLYETDTRRPPVHKPPWGHAIVTQIQISSHDNSRGEFERLRHVRPQKMYEP